MRTTTTIRNSMEKRGSDPSSQNDGVMAAEVALTWTAREFVYRKRWWWYVGFSLTALWILGLMLLLQQWTIVLLIAVAVTALYVTGLGKAGSFDYVLTGKSIEAGHRKFALKGFRAFDLESAQEQKGQPFRHCILLVPKRRFAPAIFVYLPDETAREQEIIEHLLGRLPQQALVRFSLIDRVARCLRLG